MPASPTAVSVPTLALLGAVLAMSTALATGGGAASQRVSIRTDDGVTLAATWYEPASRPGPAVILLHMLHRTRRDWDAVAQRLASEGIGALAVDLRGHGESQGAAAAADGTAAEYTAMVLDVRAARRFLAQRSDVQPTRIGVIGASLGANLAVLAAGAEAGIGSLALLSPSLDYRGLRIEAPLKKLSRPVLLVASDDDPYAWRSARELQKGAAGQREVLLLKQSGHGTTMFTHDPGLLTALVDWFRRTLL